MTEPDPVEATGPTTPVTFAVSANDSLDGALTATCADSGDTIYASGDEFPVGTTTLTCSATDIAGNVGTSDPFDVTVTDTTGPDITTSANLTESAVDADGAVVNYDPASATDLVDGAVDVTCAPASGSTFPLGKTTVECDAEDSRGNPSSESFTVTVQDDTDPIVSVPADITEEATGPNGAAVEFTVSAEDNVDGALDPTCDYESGDTFPLGPTTVSCSATDDAGNTGENSFTITVEDTTAPSLTLPDDITEEATSASGAEVTFTASAHDLVDGDVTPTCTPASGETFPIGTTTVTCSVTDEAGNTDSDTFTVTVEDTTPPEVDASGRHHCRGDRLRRRDGDLRRRHRGRHRRRHAHSFVHTGFGRDVPPRGDDGDLLRDGRRRQHRFRHVHRDGPGHHPSGRDRARQPCGRQHLADRRGRRDILRTERAGRGRRRCGR